MDISARDRDILEILIADYIATAEPVGSRAIAKRHPARLSAATVRNVMADLEERGYLAQPHTSAGRIPTERAMRYYVDSLVNVRDLEDSEREHIEKRIQCGGTALGMVLRSASRILSAISHYAGLVASPHAERIAFKHIEFLPLSSKRLLGIFVAQSGEVQNTVIECDHDYTYPEIERINNFCSAMFMGLTLKEAREKVNCELMHEEARYDKLLARAVTMAHLLLSEVPDGDVFVDGEQQLIDTPEFSEIEPLKAILHALEEKREIRGLLDRCMGSEGVKIFIGSESHISVEGISVVAAPYRQGGRVIGTLGVIGPTRMDYSRVIPVVDFTAKLVGDLIEAEA